MTLLPGSKEPEPIVFSTYDLEWWSSCEAECKAHIEHPEHEHNYNHPLDGQLRLIGVYDERGYRHYFSVEAFVKGELHERNWNRVFFAHAGGKFDFQYLFEYFVKSGLAKWRYSIEMIFNGASAFLVTLKERKWRGQYKFCDSLFLLKGSLREIGKKLGEGFYKGDIDFNTKDEDGLREYNKQDCIVLFEALSRLQKEIRDLGGDMKPTLASSAMNLFATKFLKHPLETYYPNSQEVRAAYYASRVEVFRPRSFGGFHYDINSSFPWSMTQTLPGKYLGEIDRLPDDPCETPVIAEMTIYVREDFLTPVPFRDEDKRILFPSGRWRAYFGGPDIRLMLKCGVRIEKVHKVMLYEPFHDLKGYVEVLYDLKAKEKGFKREVYKLLLNALYGKFGERQFKEKLIAFPRSVRCRHFWGEGDESGRKHENDECLRMIAPNYYMIEDFADLQHVHVPIPVFVTAYSRELLYEYLQQCHEFYYVDTDSIDCGPKDGNLPTSDRLGDLKLEHTVTSADFISPKLYRLRTEDGKTLIKSKGFSRLSDENFEKLLKGGKFELFRQRSLREAIRSQDIVPRKRTVSKGIVVREGIEFEKHWLVRRTKRFLDFANNTSRPWRIGEINQAYS